MQQNQTSENSDRFKVALQAAPAVRGVPAVLTSSGESDKLVLIKSQELDWQLRRLLDAGIRYTEVTAFVEGFLLTFKASIVRRGARLPLHLHPTGEAGKFLTELYRRRRAASGRKHSPVPMLILSVVPLTEKTGGVERA
jgi:hypothetical protein